MPSIIICTYLCLVRSSHADLQHQSECSIIFLQGHWEEPDLESLSFFTVVWFWESNVWGFFKLKKQNEDGRPCESKSSITSSFHICFKAVNWKPKAWKSRCVRRPLYRKHKNPYSFRSNRTKPTFLFQRAETSGKSSIWRVLEGEEQADWMTQVATDAVPSTIRQSRCHPHNLVPGPRLAHLNTQRSGHTDRQK